MLNLKSQENPPNISEQRMCYIRKAYKHISPLQYHLIHLGGKGKKPEVEEDGKADMTSGDIA